ncbi:MAG: Gfo/Idh/MocA family oxidoreductase [Ignavibacteriales bacterium]|nr:Gfo/Idh/MocA family oxidoreductase [Ignavibacteriales bacterium]
MNDSKKLKVGVVGTGHLGSLHAKMFSTLASVRLVGIHDADRAKGAKVASELGTRHYETVDQLLEDAEAVSVATTTKTHYNVASKALEAKRHVFIEKPITATIAEAQDLVKTAEAGKLTIQVGHIERFNPAILALEDYHLQPLFIESHRLAQFNPRGTDVAVVLDLMIHDIDLILSLVKSEVTRIDANGIAVVSESADIANARLQFENGCVANVTASRISQNKMRKMRLFQRNAYISIDFAQGLAEVFRLVDENDPHVKSTMLLGEIDQGTRKRAIVYEQPEVKDVNAMQVELDLFVASVLNGTEPVVSGRDGLQALEVAQKILQTIDAKTVRA